ncbi:MAG: type IV pilin, partial [Methanomicrobiales archaeon]|nr:type IV pilin [Methanomicrobiales archaeon]
MRYMGRHRGEDGVSEVIATILLVSVTVLLVGVVAVFFLSGPLPEEIPHASIVAKNESGNFTLAHEGGDPLRAGGYRIYIGSEGGLVDETANFTGPDGGIWLVGGNITYKGSLKIERAVVTVISGGSETILTVVGLRGGRVFDPDPGVPEKPEELEKFINFVINKSVFVYGTAFVFGGDNVNGPGATVIITGDLDTADTNLGASINVSYIYIDGNVNLGTGSAGLGSVTDPGSIYVNGSLTLWNGKRHIYGDVYVNGDFSLKDAWIHGNVYVDGNLTLGWTPTLEEDTRIYYTGNLTKPNNYNADILAKCNHTTIVPGFTMPDLEIPSTKPPEWYTDKGYTSSGPLTSNMKIFAGSYSSTSERSNATNVVIIAHTGDITITGMGSKGVTGIFFAPNGKVTFNGGTLEGVVIACDGLFVSSGETRVTFK